MMKYHAYYKRLARELLEHMGHAVTEARLRRMMFLLSVYDIQEEDPTAVLYFNRKMGLCANGEVSCLSIR